MPQLNLIFFDIPIPQTCLWEELNNQQQQLVIETLARLMIKAATGTGKLQQEPVND